MTREVDLRSLSRNQRRMLGEDEVDVVAEQLVAEEFGLAHRPDQAEWYDCVLTSTNAKTEVKSTLEEIDGRNPSKYVPVDGRFRVRRDQLRSLLSSDAAGVAWVAFVLFDMDDGTAYIQRMKPSTLSGIIADRGGWNDSGHSEFEKEHKLPYNEVFR